MGSLIDILTYVAPPVLLLLLGVVVRRAGWFKAEADASVSVLTVRVLYPCFFFYHIVGSKKLMEPSNLAFVVGSGFLCICMGFLIAWIVSRLIRMDAACAPAFTFSTGIFNYGYFAFPVAISLFGEQILSKFIVFNLGVEIAIWSVGILFLSSTGFKLSRLINPPAISILLALAVKNFGGDAFIPSYLWEIIKMLGACSIPVGLLLIGGNISDLMKGFKFSKGYKIEISSVLVRLVIVPALMILYVWIGPIPEGMTWLKKVLIVQAAMPAGIFALVVVRIYDGDRTTAMRAIMASILGCLISLPIWLMIGLNLVEN
jgi:malate permease and related proteins